MAAKKTKKKAKKDERTPVTRDTETLAAPSSSKNELTLSTDAVGQARKRELLALVNSINRKAKKQVVQFAEDTVNTYFLRRPCGVTQLDIDTGGGLPAGGFSTLSGPDQSGKSLLLYKYFAMHQRLYGDEAYIGYAFPEGGIDFEWARRVGWMIAVPDTVIEAWQEERRLRGAPLLTKQDIEFLKIEIGTNVHIGGATGEEILDNILDCVRSKLFGIVALDSIESILPAAEAELDSLEDNPQQAARASILTRFLQKYGPLTKGLEGPNYTTFIATCQVRSNRKKATAGHMARYMSDWIETVPWAVRHWRLINVTVSKGEKVKVKEGSKDTREQVGKYVKWEISKGKAGTHDGIKGEVEFRYDTLFDDLRNLLVVGMKYGVIEESQGRLTLHHNDGADPDLNKIVGADKFIELLNADFELELRVRREILSAAGKKCIYR